MKNYKINKIDEKRILGRTYISNNDFLPLFWGASACEINVKATEVWIKLSCNFATNEPWVAIEVNGYQTQRFIPPKGEPQWICIARGLNPQKENLISIIKDTQPMSGEELHSLLLYEIGLDDNGNFCKIPERKLKIEFIGDSITSGEGLAGNGDEMEWISQWMCASKTYAVQIAHKLNADWSCVSQCGWGLSWGWDGNKTAAIPPHYENICSPMWSEYQKALGSDKVFNFGDGSDLVILNLGTNDNSGLPIIKNENPDCEQIITEQAENFLKTIRKHNPKALILWTWGMIKIDKSPALIQKGIDKYITETGDKKVFSLELKSNEELEVSPEEKGSRGHPGAKTHKAAAQAILEYLSKFNFI